MKTFVLKPADVKPEWLLVDAEDLVVGRDPDRLVTVPATELSREHLGRPRPNTALLGGFAALTGVVSLHSVQDAIRQRFTGEVAEQNVAVAASAYAHVVSSKEQRRHAQTG